MQVVEFYSPSFEYFLSIYLWKDCNIYNMLCDKTFSIFWYHIIVHIASIFFHIIFIGIEKLIFKIFLLWNPVISLKYRIKVLRW